MVVFGSSAGLCAPAARPIMARAGDGARGGGMATTVQTGAPRDLRAHLAGLEAQGLLQRVRTEVDPAWEITSVARQVFLQARPERRYALLFERVRGYDQPVVVGALAASRAVYAAGLGVAPAAILERWATALRCPIE